MRIPAVDFGLSGIGLRDYGFRVTLNPKLGFRRFEMVCKVVLARRPSNRRAVFGQHCGRACEEVARAQLWFRV